MTSKDETTVFVVLFQLFVSLVEIIEARLQIVIIVTFSRSSNKKPVKPVVGHISTDHWRIRVVVGKWIKKGYMLTWFLS